MRDDEKDVQYKDYTEEQLAAKPSHAAAEALLEMDPQKAHELLSNMNEARVHQIKQYIFDKNFAFYCEMDGFRSIKNLNESQ